ncbi:MAG: hypothetical protein DI535_07615 [Citrobacter freundii]|nr:MAG: hypothetical protein DI535_07615 [Citrobacter freundii]
MEFGVRSLKEPFADVPLQSILYSSFPNDVYKEKPFLVRIVAPHKTLMEKMFLLHEKFSSKTTAGIRGDRQSRHLYDIVQLMHTSAGVEVLEDTALYEAVIEHRRHYSRVKDVDYDTLRHAELSFVPSVEWVEEFRRDYESMQTSMIYGESPSFDELLNQLKLFNGKMRLVGTGLSLDQIIRDFVDLRDTTEVDSGHRIVKSSIGKRALTGELITLELEMHLVLGRWLFQSIRKVIK